MSSAVAAQQRVPLGLRPDASDPRLYDAIVDAFRLHHESVETTMIYTRVLNQGGRGVSSPADTLGPAISREASRDNAGTAVMGIAATRFKFAASVNYDEQASRVIQRG